MAGRTRGGRESHMVKQQQLMVMVMMRLKEKLTKRRGRKRRDIITRRPVIKVVIIE